jgi:transposase
LFFDTTSTFFQRQGEEMGPGAVRVYGHSKDHRPDLPQVVIGLAVTREGSGCAVGGGRATPTT